MKNILIRAGMSPLDTFDASHIILKNSIGGNVGNLIYAYGAFRMLMTEDTTITPDYYEIKAAKAKQINEKYDAYIIPLADAFRESFIPSLRNYTALIKKLTIPVVVIGVGLRAPLEPNLDEGFPFDNDVKAFVRAVLKKSSCLGVRGEITSKYLTRLGFREGKDHVVIGCPSMYTFGRELNIKDIELTKDSIISVNSSRLSPDNLLNFITRTMKEYPNHYFIPQWRRELKLTYLGLPPMKESNGNYPTSMEDPVYTNNRVRFFLNATTWIQFLKTVDLSFGARLHGNITALLAGTPSLIIPKDARMRELAEYHKLTHVMSNTITENSKLKDLVALCDFQSPAKQQAENFDRYIRFLNYNGIDHIFKQDTSPTNTVLDQKVSEIKLRPPISPINGCDIVNSTKRIKRFYSLYYKREAVDRKGLPDKVGQNATVSDLKKILIEKEKTINKQVKILDRRSVRLAIKIADILKIKEKRK